MVYLFLGFKIYAHPEEIGNKTNYIPTRSKISQMDVERETTMIPKN